MNFSQILGYKKERPPLGEEAEEFETRTLRVLKIFEIEGGIRQVKEILLDCIPFRVEDSEDIPYLQYEHMIFYFKTIHTDFDGKKEPPKTIKANAEKGEYYDIQVKGLSHLQLFSLNLLTWEEEKVKFSAYN